MVRAERAWRFTVPHGLSIRRGEDISATNQPGKLGNGYKKKFITLKERKINKGRERGRGNDVRRGGRRKRVCVSVCL